MKIKCKNKAIKWIGNKSVSDERIEFDRNGIATVSKEVGDRLLKIYPDLAMVKSKAKDKED